MHFKWNWQLFLPFCQLGKAKEWPGTSPKDNFLKDKIRHSKVCQINKKSVKIEQITKTQRNLDLICDDYWTNNQNKKTWTRNVMTIEQTTKTKKKIGRFGPKMWWLLNKQPKTQRNFDPKCDNYWINNQNPPKNWIQNVMIIEQITKIWSDQLSVMFYFARTTHFSFVFIS